jgi:replication initiation protein RepC
MQRGQVEALLIEIAAAIGLSGRRLQALLLMMGQTRPSDWVRQDAEPVCYMAQTELARLLGKSERAVRADEAALSLGLGLIDKRTAANGGRSSHGRLGLVFSRLIARIPELLRLRETLRAERARRKELLRLRSAFYRHAKTTLMLLHPATPDHPELDRLRDGFLSWPDADALRALPLAALDARVSEARQLCDALDLFAASVPKTSGRPEENDRRHIQDTTEDESVSCRAETERNVRRAEREVPADAPLELSPRRDPRGGTGNGRACFGEVWPERIYRLSSADMKLRLDIEILRSGSLRALDIVVAAIAALPELGIHPSAWDAAAEAMGDWNAALCVVIADANRNHPAIPVRNPGGYLRAMTRAFRAGELYLTGSLIGLAERRRCGQQPG